MSYSCIGEVALSMKHGSDTNRCSEQTTLETNAEDSDHESEGPASLRVTAIGAVRGDAAIRVTSVNMIEISLNCFQARPSPEVFTHSS